MLGPTTTRRDFLRRSLATAGLVLGLPRVLQGGEPVASPLRRIPLGIIGCGGQGITDCTNFLGQPGVRVVAVCDADRSKAAALKRKVDKTYGDTACLAFQDLREMLATGRLEAVGTALPDHWHALAGLLAMRAGCDVYGQKPLTRTIREGRLLSDTARRLGRVYQTGSQQRSSPRFRQACELVRNGRLGRIQRIEVRTTSRARASAVPDYRNPPDSLDWDLWLGPAPYRPYSPTIATYHWRWVDDFGGANLADWGAHHLDIVLWSLGLEHAGPAEISGSALPAGPGMFDQPLGYDITYLLDGIPVHLQSGQKGVNGITWIGERGTLFVNRETTTATPEALLRQPLEPGEIHLPESRNHYADFLEAVATRREPIAPVEAGHRTASMALLGEIACRTGRRIRWNPQTETIQDDPGATALLDRTPRSPWLP